MNIWRAVGYYGFIYLIILVIVLVGFPLASKYASPVVSMIFPLDPGNNIVKSFWVVSLMYWGMVAAFIVMNRKKQDE